MSDTEIVYEEDEKQAALREPRCSLQASQFARALSGKSQRRELSCLIW